jgi:hypothetical protein
MEDNIYFDLGKLIKTWTDRKYDSKRITNIIELGRCIRELEEIVHKYLGDK